MSLSPVAMDRLDSPQTDLAEKLQDDTGGKWIIKPNTNCIWAAIVRIHNYFCTSFTDLQKKHVTALERVEWRRERFEEMKKGLKMHDKWAARHRKWERNMALAARHGYCYSSCGPEPKYPDDALFPRDAREWLVGRNCLPGEVGLARAANRAELVAHEALCTRYEQVTGKSRSTMNATVSGVRDMSLAEEMEEYLNKNEVMVRMSR